MLKRHGRRPTRAALIGTALAVMTLAGHTAGGGLVDPLGLALVCAIAGALGAAVSTRPPGVLRLLVVLLAGQGLLHLLLTFTSSHAHADASTAISVSAMLAGHVMAAVVATALIWHADALSARWQAFLGSMLGAQAPRPITPTEPARSDSHPQSTSAPVLLTLLHGVVRRGPPAQASLVLA